MVTIRGSVAGAIRSNPSAHRVRSFTDGGLGVGGRLSGAAGGLRTNFNTPAFGFKDGTLSRTGAGFTPQENQVSGLLAGQRGTLAGIRGNINPLRTDLQALRGQVAPGFGALTDARVQAITNARERAVGDLRAQFAARNLLGASFAQGEIASTELQFAQEEERARAEAKIEEIRLTAGLIEQELGLSTAEAQIAAQELANIQTQLELVQTQNTRELEELGITANFVSSINDIMGRLAIAEAELALRERISGGSTSIRFGPSAPGILDRRLGGGGGGTARSIGPNIVEQMRSNFANTALLNLQATQGGTAIRTPTSQYNEFSIGLPALR